MICEISTTAGNPRLMAAAYFCVSKRYSGQQDNAARIKKQINFRILHNRVQFVPTKRYNYEKSEKLA